MSAPRPVLFMLSLLAGVLACLLAPASPGAASSPPRWGAPVPIGHEIPSSWFPDIQADPTGAIRLVWTSNLAEGDGNLTHALTGAVMFSQLDQAGWGKPRDLRVMDAGIASRPLIASDGSYAHMLFRTGTLGTVRLFYTRAPLTADLGNAHSWSEPQAISDSEAYYAQLAILPDNSLVVIYNGIGPTPTAVATPVASPTRPRPSATPVGTPETPAARRTIVVSRRSSDQGRTWSFATRVSDTDERVGRVALAASPDGLTLVAAWDEGYDNLTGQGEPLGVGTARSTDGGASWGAQQAIRSPLGAIEQASVVVGADGPVLLYRAIGEPRLLFRAGIGGGERWSAESPVPGAVARPYSSKHNFDKLGLASDGDGRVLLAYVGQDAAAPKGLAVMLATYAGGRWTTPERVVAPDGYPEYPRLAVSLGNRLQLVYFVRDKEFEIGHYVLYAVAGQSDARAMPPASPPPAPAVVAAPTPALPAVRVQPYPAQLAPPTPVQTGWDRLDGPQAEVTRPAMQAIVATGLLLLALGPVVLIARWVRAAAL